MDRAQNTKNDRWSAAHQICKTENKEMSISYQQIQQSAESPTSVSSICQHVNKFQQVYNTNINISDHATPEFTATHSYIPSLPHSATRVRTHPIQLNISG